MDAGKPVIGITPCSKIHDYVESIRRAGGAPLVLSNTDDPAGAVRRVDGLLLTGGLDVEPARYGEPAHPATEAAPDRDAFEIPLSRAAVDADVPLFAICRGIQVLNVAGGGTLVQDIPSAGASAVRHAVDEPTTIAHDIHIASDSKLAAALGASAAIEACPVNSRHHQSVGRLAPSFVVSAASPDGVIEAIERPGASFCIGVQWHPENFWRTGQFAPLFEAFVAAARERRDRHHSHRETREDRERPGRGAGTGTEERDGSA